MTADAYAMRVRLANAIVAMCALETYEQEAIANLTVRVMRMHRAGADLPQGDELAGMLDREIRRLLS